MKFPDIRKPETIEKRYLGKLSQQALHLMKSLLQMDPNDRATSLEALCHPYFEGLNYEYTTHYLGKN